MSSSPARFPPLDCTVVVLRALKAARWIQSLPDAFMLRESEKQTGLSVSYGCTAAECRNTLSKSYGVLSLHVGKVRTLMLDVVPDEAKHANITGLPYKEDNPAEAERLASLLAKQARVLETGPRKCELSP